MKKIFAYFCLFFTGSLLPFIVVEFYFQDYYAIGLIGVIAFVVLSLCISIAHLKTKFIRLFVVRKKKLDNFNSNLKKRESEKEISYSIK